MEPESGPPLLTPLSEDQPIENQPAWTISVSTRRVPQYAVAVIHSNLWPGAHSFVAPNKKLFENVYVGWGTKYAAENHTPAPPPQVPCRSPLPFFSLSVSGLVSLVCNSILHTLHLSIAWRAGDGGVPVGARDH